MNTSEDSKDFFCNYLIIKALLQYVSHSERKKAEEWLAKLKQIDDGTPDSKTRNEYAFYLLINAQNGIMSQPFNNPPPQGKLRPLCKILPDYLYEDVMKQLKISYCRLNKILNDDGLDYEFPELGSNPSDFHTEQPSPHKGVSALFSVFSNYDDDEEKKS